MSQVYQTLAGYVFFELENKEAIREPLREFCKCRGIRGTILLSDEGMNVFVSGLPGALEDLKTYLHGELRVPSIDFKVSEQEIQPFRRMWVKLKREIITMRVPGIRPQEFTAPRLAPEEFKGWLDEGREMLVLDTRNDYEVRAGKFKDAVDLDVKSFTEFAEKSKSLSGDLKTKPVVMYCTGGIRCEKASAHYLKNLGFNEVYQLDGGILNYFTKVGRSHYEGDCFVFINS